LCVPYYSWQVVKVFWVWSHVSRVERLIVWLYWCKGSMVDGQQHPQHVCSNRYCTLVVEEMDRTVQSEWCLLKMTLNGASMSWHGCLFWRKLAMAICCSSLTSCSNNVVTCLPQLLSILYIDWQISYEGVLPPSGGGG
jgi:hypothetical protein